MSIIQGHAKSSGVTSFYPKTIDQSLRFEDGDSPYLNQTFSAGDDEKIFTFSAWVKRGNLGAGSDTIFGVGANNTNDGQFYFNSSNQLGFFGRASSSTKADLVTTQVFRDTSSWYHLVVAVDTTEATAADRVKFYVNGIQVTAFDSSTYPSLNDTMTFNGASVHYLGKPRGDVNPDYDGYMAEVHFTDGTAYTADDFGELKSGIWIPKSPSVTYGTNGFYLAFGDSAAIGDDTSGNGNDWTVNNLVASDVVLDSPTNNFAVLNSVSGVGPLSEGNLEQDGVTSAWATRESTIAVSSGKWYFEARTLDGTAAQGHVFGVSRTNSFASGTYVGQTADSYSYYLLDGDKYNNASATSYGASFADGDIVGVALNLDDGELTFYKNGVSQGLAFSSLPSGTYYLMGSAFGTATYHINFGQDSTFAGNTTAGGNSDANGIGDFKYAPPSGYLALCTSNLPDPVIDPAQDATPEDHFNVVTYTGDGVAPRSITGVGFQPNWTWIKARSTAYGNIVYDAVRGAGQGNELVTNTADAEGTNLAFTNLTSFDSDGFSIGSSSLSPNVLNNSGTTMVAWNWKAGGTGVSNTDGSITSTVSANTDAGFSVVTYAGEASNTTTVGHGLNSAPEMIIVKDRTAASPWQVYHASLGNTKNLTLDTSAAESTTYDVWNSTSPTSSAFTVSYVSGTWGAVNYPARNYVAYCFHSVDGFSKVGSYIGNGSADGTFVYTGFRPAFVMVKRTDSTGDWFLRDATRDSYNVGINYLKANTADADATGGGELDYLSNGFKWRASSPAINASGGSFIYLAFAEQPFKFSNSR